MGKKRYLRSVQYHLKKKKKRIEHDMIGAEPLNLACEYLNFATSTVT